MEELQMDAELAVAAQRDEDVVAVSECGSEVSSLAGDVGESITREDLRPNFDTGRRERRHYR